MNYYRKKYKKWICTDESPVGVKLNQLNNCFVDRRLKRNAKKEISSSDLINVLPRSKLSLVAGAPGTGKSTLAAIMTEQWASGEKQFQLVLFLNSLQSTLQQHVTKLVWGEFACKLKGDTEWMVYQELEKMQDNILIIIDELGKL